MDAQVLAIWSMALGAIAVVALARLAELAVRPTRSQSRGVGYHAIVFLLVLILSGVAGRLWPADAGLMQSAQVLAGPVCVGVSNYWIRNWLGADQRDGLMSALLRAWALLSPTAGLACLALPPALQLPAAAAVSLFGGVLTAWLAVRAALLGDRLAPVMAAGCLLTLPAIAGMYAMVMGLPGMGVSWHAFLALCAAASNALTGLALWRRDRHQWRTRSEGVPSSRFDPVTRLHGGATLVHKLIQAQRRRGRTGRDGALLAVLVFDVDRIAAQAGTAGVNEMFICIASRIQRQMGVVNPVCRYYERCFVSMVESIQSVRWLRTLGLRVASSLRRPMEVTAAGGERIEIRADVGVGVVHLSSSSVAVEDLLDEAQRLAQAARAMPSRAAIFDPASGRIMPVEQADLGPRRAVHAPVPARVH